MDSKKKAGDTLIFFGQEFGMPEKLNIDGSKYWCMKGNEFMKQVQKHNIEYHISEADLQN